MRIVHLSDLHFGTVEHGVLLALLRAIKEDGADRVIISGDFTQYATHEEFEKSRDFLNNLDMPYLAVPGNHDIPAFDLWERFFAPYKKYKEYIDETLCPHYEDDQVVILGINSARRILPHWNWANGAISNAQIERVKKTFKQNEARWTICTFHHPVHKIQDMPIDVTVFGARKMIDALRTQKVDIALTGHVHHASFQTIGDETHQTVFISASTALSSRTRGHQNGYNLIELDDTSLSVQTRVFDTQKKAFFTTQEYSSEKCQD